MFLIDIITYRYLYLLLHNPERSSGHGAPSLSTALQVGDDLMVEAQRRMSVRQLHQLGVVQRA